MKPDLASLSQIDAALKLLDREIWIITASDGQRRGGLLATWVAPASIDHERPTLVVGISPNHFTAELVQTSKAFAAHLLRPDQIELAWTFADGSGRNRDKLTDLAFKQRQAGAPVLVNCLAWFDCQVFARYDAGDRLFFWGEIVAATLPGPPAACLREQQFIRKLTDEQRQALAAAREADAVQNRPFQERWRSENPW